MENNNDEKRAAFFDFDGIFFKRNKFWNVSNPKIGVIGSRVPHEKGFKIFRNILEADSSALITDYFKIAEFEYEDPADSSGENIIPISKILHFARHHLFNNDTLYLVAPPGFELYLLKMTDMVFEQLENFPLFENPFHRAENIYPPEKHMASLSKPEERLTTKIIFYTSFLKYLYEYRVQRENIVHIFNSNNIFYNKIFLYHTEKDIDSMVQYVMRREVDQLVDGRNAIVPLHIADTDPKPTG